MAEGAIFRSLSQRWFVEQSVRFIMYVTDIEIDQLFRGSS